MKIENEYAVFSTGKKIACNCGLIGINDKLAIADGYDGGFSCPYGDPNYEWSKDEEYPTQFLTKEETVELADYMIGQWQKLKDRINDPSKA